MNRSAKKRMDSIAARVANLFHECGLKENGPFCFGNRKSQRLIHSTDSNFGATQSKRKSCSG